MASVLDSLMTKYDALTASAFPDSTVPPLYQNRAPQISSGLQLRPPYVVFELIGQEDLLTFEADGIEDYRLIITAYATDQGDADQIIDAIRFNGQDPDQYAGFDSTNSLAALTDATLLSMVCRRPPSPSYEGHGLSGVQVKKTVIEYGLSIERN